MSCTLPASTAGKNCTVAMVDQRDWGGCYDLAVRPAETVVTVVDTEEEGSVVANAGRYRYSEMSKVDNAEEGSSCCSISNGEFIVYNIGSEDQEELSISIDVT